MAKIKKNLSELRKAVDSCEPAKRELGIKLLDQLEYMENLLSEYQKKIKAKTVEDIILDSLQKSEGDELLEFLGGAKR